MWRAAREEQERKTELKRAGEREDKREAERAVSTIVSDFVCDQLSEVGSERPGNWKPPVDGQGSFIRYIRWSSRAGRDAMQGPFVGELMRDKG